MFASFSWQLHEGQDELSTIRSEISDLLSEHRTNHLLSNVLVVKVRNKIEYLELFHHLKNISENHPEQFYFALFAHYSGSVYRGVTPPDSRQPPAPPIAAVDEDSGAELESVVGERTLRDL